MVKRDDYLHTALPVLLTYTRQVIHSVDLRRMRTAAIDAGAPADLVAFIDAALTFQAATSLPLNTERSVEWSSTATDSTPSA
ncbi:hypothetical protein [Spongiactinospora gelatinilytica]|uniref:hypothetical protein n=1 Tax=Spongiactinospora gelatinilytica TaxID=2666298 RepID=UPI0011B93D7B|nr:hypothetical protein [Spongiactinospora gelatinilytica]